ncbi:YqaJ viral recombinase family protein [Paraburkholderia sp. BR14320]|uniref:YqaJ viral recombinase family nuclease n=1 Tax=unclassified Paraburkholderia TaxID=2615204 RepID=UPI0034CF3F2D
MNRDRESWLAERRSGIGGSDAAATVGLDPWKTALDVFLQKTGQVEAEDLDEVERVRFGNIMEAPIADEYARRYGVKVRRRNQILRNAAYPWMIANVDRVIEGRRCGLECKNVDGMAYRLGDWGEPGTDEVPEHYLLQCRHYMIVTGFDEWHLAACVGGNRLVVYVIRRDASLDEMLIEGEHAFWQCVESGHAPEPDFRHASTAGLLKKLYPATDGREIQFGADIEHWHAIKMDADARVKEYSAASEAAKNHILWTMGEAAIGRLADGSAYRRKLIEKKAYTVEAHQYIDCRHVRAKADGA